jgi:hypothetical protein
MEYYSHWVAPFGNLRIFVLINSPKLIAAYRVLLRLLMPRHPSAALSSLITYVIFTTLRLLPYLCEESTLSSAHFYL